MVALCEKFYGAFRSIYLLCLSTVISSVNILSKREYIAIYVKNL